MTTAADHPVAPTRSRPPIRACTLTPAEPHRPAASESRVATAWVPAVPRGEGTGLGPRPSDSKAAQRARLTHGEAECESGRRVAQTRPHGRRHRIGTMHIERAAAPIHVSLGDEVTSPCTSFRFPTLTAPASRACWRSWCSGWKPHRGCPAPAHHDHNATGRQRLATDPATASCPFRSTRTCARFSAPSSLPTLQIPNR